MINLQVKIDEQLRNEAQAIAASMGMDLATTIRIFLHQMVHEKSLPFKPSAGPFSPTNARAVLPHGTSEIDEEQSCNDVSGDLHIENDLTAKGGFMTQIDVERKLNSVGKTKFVENFELFQSYSAGQISKEDAIQRLVRDAVIKSP